MMLKTTIPPQKFCGGEMNKNTFFPAYIYCLSNLLECTKFMNWPSWNFRICLHESI